MSQDFGIESHREPRATPHRKPARFLVVIDSAGSTIARLFDASLGAAGEFDAGTEEVALMARGLAPVVGALGTEWDTALDGHSAAERATADVYTLDL